MKSNQIKKRIYLSIYLSIYLCLFLLLIFIMISLIIGCSGKNSDILPVVPSHPIDIDNVDSFSGRNKVQSSGRGAFVKLITTGPAQYISSKLTPPVIIESQLTFSARVEGSTSALSNSDFVAKIDGEDISCSFNANTNEAYFTPAEPIDIGYHVAMLYFKNPDGMPVNCYWHFNIETRPPQISMVMWNCEERIALVMFESLVEPGVLTDMSRWQFNTDSNILRSNIVLAGNNVAILPLNNTAIIKYIRQEPLSVIFNHPNGIASYVVNRGGEARTAQIEPPCDCTYIKVEMLRELHYLEAGAEMYAFAYNVTNPEHCGMRLRIHNWTLVPQEHDNPGDIFDTECDYFDDMEDSLCEGDSQEGYPTNPFGLEFNMNLSEGIHTATLDRRFKHSLFVSFWANCTTDDYAPGDPFETCVGQMQLNFFESFDCTNPVFDHAPEVLYGSEIAERLLDWTEDWDFYGENTGKDNYCWSMTRAYFQTAYVDLFADPQYENACKLFVIAEASDMVTTLRGNIRPLAMDIKRIGASEGCEYGNVLVDCGMGLFYDERPWAGRFGVSQGDMELITDWPDHNYCYGEPPACAWHDWCGEEGVISIFPISSLLLPASGDDIVDIRIRAMDNSPNYQGIHGNWIRSENILNQIFGRSGQRLGASEPENSYYATVKFMVNSPYDNTQGSAGWKVYNYQGDTTDCETSLISRRDPDGNAVLHVVIMVETDEPILEEEQYEIDQKFPDRVWVEFKSDEVLPDGFTPQKTRGYAARYDLYTGEHALPDDLNFDRMQELFAVCNPPDILCKYTFYYLKLIVTDAEWSVDGTDIFISPKLYVSSRDHLLGQEQSSSFENLLDYAESHAMTRENPDTLHQLDQYGKNRGLGYVPSGKTQWYGYDEYLINGGFEVVEVTDTEFIEVGDPPFPYVPVQSESDIIMIHGHGATDTSENNREIAGIEYYPCGGTGFRPHYQNMQNHWNANMQIFLGTAEMGPFDDEMRAPDSTYAAGEHWKYPDFGTGSYAWGDFWWKDEAELRWLVLVSCTNLSSNGDSTTRPDKNWQKVISNGYVQSICGFSGNTRAIYGFLAGDNPRMTKNYSKFLQEIIDDKNCYNPASYCYKCIDHWDSTNSLTHDPSIAAWMEAGWETLVDVDRGKIKEFMRDCHAETACAIDASHKWIIEGVDEYVESGNPSKIRIVKKPL
jgi:hypothetical protein